MTQKNNAEYYQQLNDKYGPIEIKCRGADMLPLEAIADFQGKLKKRSQDSKRRLALSMFSKGFIAPFFVWEKDGTCKILDGHARDEVLREIRAAGISVPDLFPVDYIDAENEQDAREKLLSITSQYGEFDKDELALWLDDLDNEIKESLRIVDEEMFIKIDVPFIEEDIETNTSKKGQYDKTKMPINIGALLLFLSKEEQQQLSGNNSFDIFYSDNINLEIIHDICKKKITELADEICDLLSTQ
jgi:hypothetical protein